MRSSRSAPFNAIRVALALLVTLGFTGCRDSYTEPEPDSGFVIEVPDDFPTVPIPPNNTMTTARVALGKKLFFDPVLSRDNSVSCGSCHLPELAFATNDSLAIGIHGQHTTRNAPSLANVGYGMAFFRDGGAETLELQVHNPLESELEMDLPLAEAATRLETMSEYMKLIREAYPDKPTTAAINHSLAAFQRTLISGNSRYDQYMRGDQQALTAEELRGKAVFFSEQAKCSSCHSGFNFTNEGFENNGLYATYVDKGRARVTLDSADVGKFKVPSLRNVALTWPYMHNGSLSSLAEVMEHYAGGGKGHYNQHPAIAEISLSEQDMNDLVRFLNALTDETFVSDVRHRPDQ